MSNMIKLEHRRTIGEKGGRSFYIASLDGRPEISGAGDSPSEAVGELILRNKERFDIEVLEQ